jgi:hypothetical protein
MLSINQELYFARLLFLEEKPGKWKFRDLAERQFMPKSEKARRS